jgi:hypothetical protein
MDSVLTDGLLIFGGLVILLAPLTLALADSTAKCLLSACYGTPAVPKRKTSIW